MKYFFLAAFSTALLPASGQVLFRQPASALASHSDSVTPVATRLQVTYMGKPLSTALSPPVPGNPRDGRPVASYLSPLPAISGPALGTKKMRNPGELRADSLMRQVLMDSLVVVSRRLGQLGSSLSANPTLTDGNGSRTGGSDLLRDVPSIMPVWLKAGADYRVSSGFGLRYHPITGSLHTHMGIDLAQPMRASVYATADGVVDRVIWQPEGLGLAVYVAHASGYQTVYGHLETHAVTVGEYVRRGQLLGQVGATGRATGPHLHYSVLVGGQAVDPSRFLFSAGPSPTKKQPQLPDEESSSPGNWGC